MASDTSHFTIVNSRIAQVVTGTAFLLVVLALVVLLGWASRIYFLTSIVPGGANMKANTAVGFLLIGVALLRQRRREHLLYGLGVLVIGTATLAEYLSGFDFGIDQLLLNDPLSTVDPGRMSQITAVGFSLLGFGLLLMQARPRLSRGLGLLVGGIGFVALLGYSYDTQTLYRVGPYTSIALHTAVGFVIAAVGIQCAIPAEGLAGRITATTAGGAMLRHLLPAAVLIPFLFGFAAWFGHKHLGWASGFAVAVLVAATIACLATLIVRNAGHLDQRDFALRQTRKELGEAQRLARVGSWVWDIDSGAMRWSDELYHIHGLDPRSPPPLRSELSQFFTHQSWIRLNAAMQEATEAIQGTSVRELELEVIHPDGTKKMIVARGEAIRGPDGRVVYLRGTSQDVTQQREITQKMLENQTQLATIIASAMDAIITLDNEHRILIFNAAAEKMFRCSAQDVIGTTIDRFIPQRFRTEHPEHIRKFREEGMASRSAVGALWGVRATGDEFPIEASISHAEAGGKHLLTVVIRDVTERRDAEEALRAAERQFRRVVEHIGDALIVDDVKGNVVFANDRFLEMFGFRRDELPNITIEDYVAPEYRTELRHRHESRIKGEAVPIHFEYEGCHRNGKRMWLEVDVVSIEDQHGKVVGTQSALREITARKESERVLRESEERFRLVANAAPVMIWMSNTDKLCIYFNKQWLNFTGRPIESELGTGWAEGVHPDDVTHCLQTYNSCFDQRHSFNLEYRLRRHDGEYRWILDAGVPRFNADGSFAGYIGSCIDVTERKELEEALHNVSGKLIAAQEEERRHIARELHDDINQQLALLHMSLDQLKRKPPRVAELCSRMDELLSRISRIESDIQALSHRLHSSKLEYLGLVMAVKGFCEEFAVQHQVEVRLSHEQVPDSMPKDVSLCLFRVVQAALTNALKHSGVKSFEVHLCGTAAGVHLSVRDKGTGFDLENVLKGHGLGLISMHERVHLLKGKLSVQSKPHGGTTIEVDVPLLVLGSRSHGASTA